MSNSQLEQASIDDYYEIPYTNEVDNISTDQTQASRDDVREEYKSCSFYKRYFILLFYTRDRKLKHFLM